MTCYSLQLIDRIFVKGYVFLSLARKMGKNISEIFNSKYS